MVRPRTEIWKHFTEEKVLENGIEKVYAKCNIENCGHTSKLTDGSTSGMRRHLIATHSVIWLELEKQQNLKKRKGDVAYEKLEQSYEEEHYEKEKGGHSSTTFGRGIKKRRLAAPSTPEKAKNIDAYMKYKPQDKEQLRGDLEIAILLARCNLPFNLVESDGFKDFLGYFCPKMLIKKATTYSKYKLPLVHENVKNAVDTVLKAELPKCPGFALSSDLWSSRSNDSYQAVTLHYIREDFQLRMFVIGTGPFAERHTADAIAGRLDTYVSAIPGNDGYSSVVCVHDSAANMKAAIRKCTHVDDSLLCADHLLNLVVENSIQETKSVGPVGTDANLPNLESAFAKAQALAAKCHRSNLSEQRIEKEYKALMDDSDLSTQEKASLKVIKIISPVKTRWNSVYMMLESIMRMRVILSSIRDNPGNDIGRKLAESIPSEEDFNLFDEVLPILKRICETSENLSADKEVCIHRVIAHLYGIKYRAKEKIDGKALSATAEMFHRKLLKHLEKYFPNCGADNTFYAVANLLNPLYKGKPLKKLNAYDAAYEALITNSEAHQKWLDSLKDLPANVQHQDLLVPEDDPYFDLMKDEEMAVIGPAEPPTQSSSTVTEWEMYTKLPAQTGTDVLQFWKENSSKFPLLSQAARKWLCVPASSAPSERVFSAGGNIVSYKRTKLQPEQVEKLLYIQQNYDRVKTRKYMLTSTDELPAEEQDKPFSQSCRTSTASTMPEGI